MNKLIALAALSAVLTPALARADVFNGPYAGVQAGWERNRLDNAFSVGSADYRKSALSYGLNLGYDAKIAERFVVGLEGGLGFTTGSETHAGTTLIERVKPQRSMDLSVRAGLLAAPNSLFYVRTGYSNARFKFEDTLNGVKTANASNAEGWLLGGGLEHAFTDKVSGRVEYRHTDFEGNRNNRNQVLVGVGYHF